LRAPGSSRRKRRTRHATLCGHWRSQPASTDTGIV